MHITIYILDSPNEVNIECVLVQRNGPHQFAEALLMRMVQHVGDLNQVHPGPNSKASLVVHDT